jgi:hypothetical protein
MRVTARPNTAPAYYLGRPANVWINAVTRRTCARCDPAFITPVTRFRKPDRDHTSGQAYLAGVSGDR